MPDSNGSLPRLPNEWNRLRADFEREASAYHDIRLSVYFHTKDVDLKGEWDHLKGLLHHAVILWTYCGKVAADGSDEDVDNAAPEFSAIAVIEGSSLELFMRMAYRAGSLVNEGIRKILSDHVSANVVRAVGGVGSGTPVMAWNSNPLAVWLNFVLLSIVTDHPTRYRVPTLPVDPFAASLSPIDFITTRSGFLNQAKVEESATSQSAAPTPHNDPTDGITDEGRALAILTQHPEWTNKKIAKEVGCDRRTLYKWPRFMEARRILKQSRQGIPKGSKNGETGEVDAWDDERK